MRDVKKRGKETGSGRGTLRIWLGYTRHEAKEEDWMLQLGKKVHDTQYSANKQQLHLHFTWIDADSFWTTPRPNRCSFCRCSPQIKPALCFFNTACYTLPRYPAIKKRFISFLTALYSQGTLCCTAVLQDHCWSTYRPSKWFNIITGPHECA